jgi:hypothetical protein
LAFFGILLALLGHSFTTIWHHLVLARFGAIWFDLALFGAVWHDLARFGGDLARFGNGAKYLTIFCTILEFRTICNDLARFGTGTKLVPAELLLAGMSVL